MSTAKGGGNAGEGNGGAASGKGKRSRAGGTSGMPSGAPVAPPAGSVPAAPLTVGRVGIYVLLLVAGVLVAGAGTLVQAAWFPGGLALALAGVGGLFYGGGRATGTSAGVLVPGAAWLVTVFLLLSNVRPEGDFLFGAGLGSYIFLLGGIVVAVICATAQQMRPTGVRPGRVGG
ncbi:hypothetical protein CP981_25450 [Streptomyces platensis]|uniref:Integral membrane protein n=1 Tax=Streptomyces platensis TaxID=58346 RepID=A0AAE6TP49_STRPT|nr:DUF6113 family protein [Streptomyces platensis]OSY45289.1 hypothetical protein BG653_03259 [Streptomyces platensis]QEV54527.1 hypothetical protein CP981_25450 [Streptomyces platensis]